MHFSCEFESVTVLIYNTIEIEEECEQVIPLGEYMRTIT